MSAPARSGAAPAGGFATYWQEMRTRIDAGLAGSIPGLFGGPGADLQDAVRRSVAGGKRIRGCLVCLACEALGGTIEDAMPRALAIEYVQAASLLHDDFVDADRVRRQAPAGWIVDGARRAVLLADVMFATSLEQMVELSARDGAITARAISNMARGAYEEFRGRTDERRDAAQETRAPPADTYDALIAGKTGALFGAAAELGAQAAGAVPEKANAIRAYGILLGEAYQIADDRADLRESGGAAAESALPAAVARHFAGDRGEQALARATRVADVAGNPAAYAPEAIERSMEQAVARRTEKALVALDMLPVNAFTRLLREVPAHILRETATGGR